VEGGRHRRFLQQPEGGCHRRLSTRTEVQQVKPRESSAVLLVVILAALAFAFVVCSYTPSTYVAP
jgi:hypothetical protein